MEIHQLISKLQTPSKEEIRYKVGEVQGKSPTSEVEQAGIQRLCKEQALIRIIIVVSCLLTIVFVILVN